MNSYLLATGDPSRSTLRLFQEGDFYLQLAIAALEFFQSCPLAHRQLRLWSRFLLLPVLLDPAAKHLWVQLKFPGNFGDRLARPQRDLDGFLTELR